MSSKILAIFGATGQQGSSVLRHVLSSPHLSSQFSSIRALTRDPSSPAAQKLLSLSTPTTTVTLARADVTDPATLIPAVTGAHTVFAVTNPTFTPNTEYENGKAIADACVAGGVSCLIWSTLPPAAALSAGKYTRLNFFDDKARIEHYIREELVAKNGGKIKAAFVCVASYMENFATQDLWIPKLDERAVEGGGQKKQRWVVRKPQPRESKIALVAAGEDLGKFVGAILADPDRFEGLVVNVAEGMYSMGEIVESISRVLGKEVVYEQVGVQEFKREIPFLPEVWVEFCAYLDEFGLFGQGEAEEEAVKKAREVVKGEKLTGLDEFLNKYPLKLD